MTSAAWEDMATVRVVFSEEMADVSAVDAAQFRLSWGMVDDYYTPGSSNSYYSDLGYWEDFDSEALNPVIAVANAEDDVNALLLTLSRDVAPAV